MNLPIPVTWSKDQRAEFCRRVEAVIGSGVDEPSCDEPSVLAAVGVVTDLVNQGWKLALSEDQIELTPPTSHDDPEDERDRIRAQELVKRAEQLCRPTTIKFIERMESPREFRGEFVSIFNLMRDGNELADALMDCHSRSLTSGIFDVSTAIDPVIQIVEPNARCAFTGLQLSDIWRYFRHTWTNQSTTTPGRTLALLIRDRSARYWPVIGIAALGSPIVQMRERDEWIGWQREQIITTLKSMQGRKVERWIEHRMETQLSEIYLADLVGDGLYWPSLWNAPTPEAILRLEEDSRESRRLHNRFVNRSEFEGEIDDEDPEAWVARSTSHLFRSKRSKALASLLKCRLAIRPFMAVEGSRSNFKAAFQDPAALDALATIARRAKSDSVGTEIADLTVCGAIAPYNEILAGKLVSMLSVGPSVVAAYRNRYSSRPSLIASSMAGRPITRANRLVFVGTTSLYSTRSSQYNRVAIPKEILGGIGDIRYQRLGMSRSFGTSQYSDETVRALTLLAERTDGGVRVNSIFGEGVSPKLRKVRHGLDLLGWPSDQLLQHGRARIIYGVPLIQNLLPYLVGLDSRPRYLYPTINRADGVAQIRDWWASRWLKDRLSTRVDRVRTHSNGPQGRHGARVS